jgi:arylsulfatase A-like enzyme
MKSPSFFLLAGLLAWGSLAAGAEQVRPNILLFIADNWGRHASAYGTEVLRTPNFDRVAREGVLFNRAFCPVPSCTPTRSAMLTGQAPHRLAHAANLWSQLDQAHAVYPDLLEAAGYVVGHRGKGWGPGLDAPGGRTRNPAGPQFKTLATFLDSVPAGRPFCFWDGNTGTARQNIRSGAGAAAGLSPAAVRVPPSWPDAPEIRAALADYYESVQRMDAQVGEVLRVLEDRGLLERTVVVVGSDNGWQFPRGLANCHDSGCHVPLALRWGRDLAGPGGAAGRRLEEFVDLTDLAPTFLEIAGLRPLPVMTGRSLLPLLRGEAQTGRDAVFLERERHANVRAGDVGYPCRGIRTARFLYLRNLRPARWPAGDPQLHFAVGPFGDADPSPVKDYILAHRDEPAVRRFYELNFGLRPAEELYDLTKDPDQLVNVAGRADYAAAKRELGARLDRWMRDTADPRAGRETDEFDRYPYYGKPAKR